MMDSPGRMRYARRMTGFRRAGAVAALLGLASQEAFAFLQTGTLLTNSASATYSAGSQGTSVTYSATAKILIANPDVYLWKDVNPTYVSASAGGVVTFLICFSNGGANTAFNVTVTDKLPLNTYWGTAACGGGPGYFNGTTYAKTGSIPDGNISFAWATALGGPWAAGCPSTQPAGGSSAYFLRWTVSRIDIGRSATP